MEKPDYSKIKVSSIDLNNIKATTLSENMAAPKQRNVMNYQDDLLEATDLIFKAKKEANNISDTNIQLRDEIEMLKGLHEYCRKGYIESQAELYNEKRKSGLSASIAIICFIFAVVCSGLLILE